MNPKKIPPAEIPKGFQSLSGSCGDSPKLHISLVIPWSLSLSLPLSLSAPPKPAWPHRPGLRPNQRLASPPPPPRSARTESAESRRGGDKDGHERQAPKEGGDRETIAVRLGVI